MAKNKPENSQEFINLLYEVVELLGGTREILAIIGSWGDTQEDEELLGEIKVWIKLKKEIDGKQPGKQPNPSH
jgi:hypothetical protein